MDEPQVDGPNTNRTLNLVMVHTPLGCDFSPRAPHAIVILYLTAFHTTPRAVPYHRWLYNARIVIAAVYGVLSDNENRGKSTKLQSAEAVMGQWWASPSKRHDRNKKAVPRKREHTSLPCGKRHTRKGASEDETAYSTAATRRTASRSWSSDLSRLNRT